MPSTVDLTITESNGVYSVSPDPCEVPPGDDLKVIVPTGGCLICLNKDLGSTKSHKLLQDKTFNMSSYPNASQWNYEVYGPNDTCPSGATETTTHVIQIGSGMGGK
jgi:hypothetical protein